LVDGEGLCYLGPFVLMLVTELETDNVAG